MSAPLKVLLVAEGRSEFGDLERSPSPPRRERRSTRTEGYFPPMLRKLIGRDIAIDAHPVAILPKFDKRVRIPGHGDRAAKALAIASALKYDLLVFVKDVDKEASAQPSERERARQLARVHREIEAGFAEVANSVPHAKATPCRMLEAWALGDADAIDKVRNKRVRGEKVPSRPEQLWGAPLDPNSNHPKRILERVLGEAPSAHTFEAIAKEALPEKLRAACPESFKPFVDDLKLALAQCNTGPAEPKPHR